MCKHGRSGLDLPLGDQRHAPSLKRLMSSMVPCLSDRPRGCLDLPAYLSCDPKSMRAGRDLQMPRADRADAVRAGPSPRLPPFFREPRSACAVFAASNISRERRTTFCESCRRCGAACVFRTCMFAR